MIWFVVLTNFNHLEKYEFVNGKNDIPYFMENKTCLKPPTRCNMIHEWNHLTENILIQKHIVNGII